MIFLLFGLTSRLTTSPAEILLWDFRNNLWGPSHLLVNRHSPYVITQLFPDSNAVWFPMLIGLLFPLGWMGLSQASLFWLLSSIFIAALLLVLAAGKNKPNLLLFAVGLLMIFLHPRVFAHFRLGQFTLLATLLYIVATHTLEDKKYFVSAFLLTVASSKPQLGIFVVPGLFLVAYRTQGRKGAFLLFGYSILATIILCLPLFMAYPGWLEGFLWALNRNQTWMHPSLFSLLPHALGKVEGYFLWGLLAIMLFVINIRLWMILPPRKAVYWSLALTPLATPYIWSWDIALMFPLLLQSLFALSSNRALVLLVSGYVMTWWLSIQVVMQTDGSDHRFWWLPWALLTTILVSYWGDGKWQSIFSHPTQQLRGYR